jgi:hypothetical protein
MRKNLINSVIASRDLFGQRCSLATVKFCILPIIQLLRPSSRADCGPSLHLHGFWANLEEAAVHMAVELKNAAFDLMAAESRFR